MLVWVTVRVSRDGVGSRGTKEHSKIFDETDKSTLGRGEVADRRDLARGSWSENDGDW
jgi:hypothetical protein